MTRAELIASAHGRGLRTILTSDGPMNLEDWKPVYPKMVRFRGQAIERVPNYKWIGAGMVLDHELIWTLD